MQRFGRSVIAVFFLALISTPLSASAANVFGGRVGASVPCFNIAIWDQVGPPRQGLYIYSPGATRLYPKNKPVSGNYVIGLYSIPYFCIVSVAPLLPLPGILMTMVGTS